jgi:DNA topoisomerase-1
VRLKRTKCEDGTLVVATTIPVCDTPDPREHARAARLVYVSDASPGIIRERRGGTFAYRLPSGERLADEEELARIRALVIPPAWTDVWICPTARGHLQATGRDARGRKQYRYHADWRSTRDAAKFDRLPAFARALPRLRARVADDMRRAGLPREKVLATIVHLLETTLIRVGNDEYARQNGSFGLTTLRNEHVAINGGTLVFKFVGKGGKRHNVDVRSARLARVVRRMREVPGQELFQYVDDDGVARSVGSGDVNDYLRDVMGDEFSAKDFRTWQATVLAASMLAQAGAGSTVAESKRIANEAIAATAAKLGNTPAICRTCYVHPAVIEAYMDGVTIPAPRPPEADAGSTGLSAAERNVLRLVEERPAAAPQRRRRKAA